jgi:peroxiredoxin
MQLRHALFLLCFSLVNLHADEGHDGLPGHSQHGEAFNEGPRQAAVLIPGCGKVNFPVTTKKPEAQQFFNQGVGQLHGFWYYEAERTFRQVATLDKECAMAFWGMAMANVNNEKRAREFTKKAVALKAKANAHEKLWITTLENFYREDKNDKRDKKQRSLDYIRDLETIVQEHPGDVEAKAFLVWKIWQSNGEAPITSNQAVDALMDQIFAANPQHPAHHYRIHLWDGSKPARALKSAAQNGQVAPGIAHMWHMPGHTFSKLKRFDDAAWQQEASTRVDHAHMIKNWILPDQIHNYAHNEEWLVRTFNELGRAKDGLGLARSQIRIPQHPAFNTLDKEGDTASYGRTRLIDTLILWELWDDLLKETDSPLIGPVTQPGHEAKRLRARGLAFFHKGDAKSLASTIAALTEIEVKAKAKEAADKVAADKAAADKVAADKVAANKVAANKVAADKVAADKVAADKATADKATADKATADKATADKVAVDKAKDTAAKTVAPKQDYAKPVATASKGREGEKKKYPATAALTDLRALQAVLTKDKSAGDLLTKATEMPKPLLASLYLKLGDKKKAEDLVKNYPQDLAGLAAKTEMQQALGKTEEAKKTFEQVRKLAFAMDSHLPVKHRLDALAKTYGITGEWRAPAPKREDSGVRPSLETLGPMYWHPPAAPKWEALTLEGKTVTNAQFAGKPHVLIFYLGAACSHCMTQVNAFAKAAPDYEKAGIALAAVTLEPLSLAGRITEQMSTKKLPPFPIFCDPSQAMFKTFRAYDDFEAEPLHAALLVDAKGRLRWLDISWQPFSDTAFLLKEAQRLLKLPEE